MPSCQVAARLSQTISAFEIVFVMPNWKQITAAFFKNADPSNEYHHWVGNGADSGAIASAESKIGLEFPAELRDFYAFSNGLGMTTDQTESRRFVPTLEDLPAFVGSARSFFSSTHASLSARYLPVIDWENGDTAGYLLQTEGGYFPFVVNFSHELYSHNENQDPSEFLHPIGESLAMFLGQ